MSKFPIFCANSLCKNVFPHDLSAEPERGGTGVLELSIGRGLVNVSSNRCPKCSSVGLFYSGVYRVSDDKNSFAQLVENKDVFPNLITDIEKLIKEQKEPERIIAAIEKVSPALASISRMEVKKRDYAAWIAIVLALLTLLKDIHLGYFKKEDTNSSPREFVEYLLKENAELKQTQKNIASVGPPPKAPAKVRQPARAERKPERNATCPCGSGKKFKKCHGLK